MQMARTSLLVVLFVAVALTTTLIAAGTVLGIPGPDLPAVAMLFAQVGGGVGLLALAGMQPRVLQRLGGVRATGCNESPRQPVAARADASWRPSHVHFGA